MNRIYQGKVTCAEICKEGANGRGEDDWEHLDYFTDRLWKHHEVFQDAVNYYVLALLALVNDPENKLMPIRSQLVSVDENGKPTDEDVWSHVRRRGAKRLGMRDSVAKYLELEPNKATPEACFKKILEGNDVDADILNLALEELLLECNGDGAIQQKGREMLPRFCWAGFSGAFPRSRAQMEKKDGERRLYTELHLIETDVELRRFAQEVELRWVVNLNEKAPAYEGIEARTRLQKGLDHFRQIFGVATGSTKMGDRVRKFLEGNNSAESELAKINEALTAMGEDTLPVIPKNRKSIPDRSEALLLFKYFPNAFTHELLKVSFPEKKIAETSEEKDPLLQFGDDPIRLGRGDRGYIFPAFTSLSRWESKGKGEPAWKEFDIAAFKEALKALHQIEVKGEERDKERAQLEYRLTCMVDGVKWKPAGEGEEEAPPILKGDPRIPLLESILKSPALKVENEMTGGEARDYGLSLRTIRGFKDIRQRWNKIAPEGKKREREIEDALKKVLRDYQREKSEFIGSVNLFEQLLQADWVIWQKPSAKTVDEWRQQAKIKENRGFAMDPLMALIEKNEIEEEILRLKEPIRFTPADARYSRRQFYFSDVCNFTSKGDYRHEPNQQSVVVPLLLKEERNFSVRRVRLSYSAPRLLRDGLRKGAGEDLKSASFLQPMMEALGLTDELNQDISNHAVALMPDVLENGDKRILLNFPIGLDVFKLMERLGCQQIWEKQFVAYNKKNFYLRWPELDKTGKAESASARWWEVLDSFTCLSVDLGQRDAGAFAVLDVRANGEFGKKPFREIGTTGEKVWRSAVAEMGMFRLPGEDAKIFKNGVECVEAYGERGRTAEPWEWDEALERV